MQQELFEIDGIPAALWGPPQDKVMIAVHGNMSNKTDIPIEILAKKAVPKGYQVLSFDLPQHGDRASENPPCKVEPYIKDLNKIMTHAKGRWPHLYLFANSMGAYFSLLAYQQENIEKVWFLSPLVDMGRMIENIMKWFNITEEQLEAEQTIATPIGQTLYWDYYCYVKAHPITDWNIPTLILYGSEDEVCEKDRILQFKEQFSCELKLVEDAKHYFHTPEQLEALNLWLYETL
ncbi:alpha/beta hydrolase [Aminipila butyrica]|uniref:Alpha/beta hydrolase n=1 Tax=Aminipila butyrica TaxID=433296 RepID=A0A858BSH2_9FIRM|nr:alpha/beta fold hydrolase [Aminipila butyrica]QIB68853.1 alpha/beta hydrolase [Aminipila butyrica]